MLDATKLGLYIHVPFCRSRCNYCDFNTYASMDSWIPAYLKALVDEIGWGASLLSPQMKIRSLYFGGGTPTLLPSDAVTRIMQAITQHYPLGDDLEVTFEANPGGLSLEYLRTLRAAGVNRLSLGMQSAHDSELLLLGRRHSLTDVLRSIQLAGQAGIVNLSLDLMFALPGQQMWAFQESLKQAMALGVQHLSLYSLTLEEHSPLANRVARGELPAPDPDMSADMYAWAMEKLSANGFGQYEISNWAVDDESRCQHNLIYWHNDFYLGFGAGAHSHFIGRRWANTLRIPDYVAKMAKAPKLTTKYSAAAQEKISLSQREMIQETLIMGLRLVKEGINSDEFTKVFGSSLGELYPQDLEWLFSNGLIEKLETKEGRIYRLTPRAIPLGNQVFLRFIDSS